MRIIITNQVRTLNKKNIYGVVKAIGLGVTQFFLGQQHKIQNG